MIEQITKGIKITVGTSFEGKRYQNLRMYYAFSYAITIENQSSDTVQLISRHWNIYDSLSDVETVDGEGVVGLDVVDGYFGCGWVEFPLGWVDQLACGAVDDFPPLFGVVVGVDFVFFAEEAGHGVDFEGV